MTCRRIMVGCLFLAVAALGWLAYSLLSTWYGIPDAYAAWDTGTLIIEYLDTHEGQWPRSWGELLTAEGTLRQHGRRLHTESRELPRRIKVDFSADPAKIARIKWSRGTQPVRVVTRADGKDFPVIWENAEPNAMIWMYLQPD